MFTGQLYLQERSLEKGLFKNLTYISVGQFVFCYWVVGVWIVCLLFVLDSEILILFAVPLPLEWIQRFSSLLLAVQVPSWNSLFWGFFQLSVEGQWKERHQGRCYPLDIQLPTNTTSTASGSSRLTQVAPLGKLPVQKSDYGCCFWDFQQQYNQATVRSWPCPVHAS